MVVLSEVPTVLLLQLLPTPLFFCGLRLLGIESSWDDGSCLSYGLLIGFLDALDLSSSIEAQLVGWARRFNDQMLLSSR